MCKTRKSNFYIYISKNILQNIFFHKSIIFGFRQKILYMKLYNFTGSIIKARFYEKKKIERLFSVTLSLVFFVERTVYGIFRDNMYNVD